MFVIKFNKELYWCGFNETSPHLGKAAIFYSRKTAEDVAVECLNNAAQISGLPSGTIFCCQIIEIELKEK